MHFYLPMWKIPSKRHKFWRSTAGVHPNGLVWLDWWCAWCCKDWKCVVAEDQILPAWGSDSWLNWAESLCCISMRKPPGVRVWDFQQWSLLGRQNVANNYTLLPVICYISLQNRMLFTTFVKKLKWPKINFASCHLCIGGDLELCVK